MLKFSKSHKIEYFIFQNMYDSCLFSSLHHKNFENFFRKLFKIQAVQDCCGHRTMYQSSAVKNFILLPECFVIETSQNLITMDIWTSIELNMKQKLLDHTPSFHHISIIIPILSVSFKIIVYKIIKIMSWK